MSSDLFPFEWGVCSEGYQWVRGKDEEGWGLADDPSHTEGHYRTYAPLQEHTGLFRHFAETSPTHLGIQEFANTYGLLGGRIQVYNTLYIEGRPEERVPVEPLSFWQQHIRDLRVAVQLWDWLKSNDVEGFRAGLPEVLEVLEPYVEEVAFSLSYRDFAQLRRQAEAGELEGPAFAFLNGMIENNLRNTVSPQLVKNPEGTGFNLVFAPDSLLGVLWLQFAQAISGYKEYRRCQLEGCGKWFEISLEQTGFRKSRHYCSDRCRIKAYRTRQDEARQLRANGTTVKDIAAQLGSDTKTVRGWVQQVSRPTGKRHPRKRN